MSDAILPFDIEHSHGHSFEEEVHCGVGGGADTLLGLRVAAIFVILVGSSCGALFPVLARRSSWLHVPKSVFECVSFAIYFLIRSLILLLRISFAKYFGSGVIVSLACARRLLGRH